MSMLNVTKEKNSTADRVNESDHKSILTMRSSNLGSVGITTNRKTFTKGEETIFYSW